MKRFLSFALILSCLISLLPSCVHLVPQRPSDYVTGTAVVIDNITPFVYDESMLEDDTRPVEVEGKTYNVTAYSMMNYCCRIGETAYTDFTRYYGNKIVRHYQNGESESYYTVFTEANYQLLYVFLEPDENGVLRFQEYIGYSMDARYTIRHDMIFEQDQPAAILGDRLPDSCYLDYYSPQELAKNNERIHQLYLHNCAVLNLPSLESIQLKLMREKTEASVYRCLQSSSFDVIDPVRNYAWHGFYCYDLILYEDGTGSLHYRHFIDKAAYEYELDEEATVSLTAEELIAFTTALQAYDFPNIPTWNPEELFGFDGETTYLIGGNDYFDTHLIGMWGSSPRHGIYHLRTALEDLAREKIHPTSGRVYVDYES
ncbi:MAG: hypothetical protein E7620_00715 [Ruminococcaceae bacterium]|nr:hypothetical protein [Oscillospiraceae bacterium]